MKMPLLIAAMAYSLSAHAGVDELINKACSIGNPWRLTPPPPGFSTTEAPIKLNGAAGRMVLICNCTGDVPGKNTGVWVRASMSPDTLKTLVKTTPGIKPRELEPGPANWPYYLPGKSCMSAGSITVMLGPVDNSIETWGTSTLEQAAGK